MRSPGFGLLAIALFWPGVVLAQAGPPTEEEGEIVHEDDPVEDDDPIPDTSDTDDQPTEELPEGEDESTMRTQWDPAVRPDPDPQPHEVGASFDATVANRANGGLTRVDYLWTPGGIDRHDPAVAMVRRFVLAKSWLRVAGVRDGSTIETRTSLAAEGVWRPAGRLVVGLGVGLELDSTKYDVRESGYWAAPVTAIAGGRPLERLELAAVARWRPILSSRDSDLVSPAFRAGRSGHDRDLGGRLTWASGSDHVLAELEVTHHEADWELEGFHPGPMTVSGLRAVADLRFQLTKGISLGVIGRYTAMHWNNQRLGDEGVEYIGEDRERDVAGFEGDLLFWYWFEGRTAFRFSLGGGFQQEAPVFYTVDGRGGDRGFFRLGLGVQARF